MEEIDLKELVRVLWEKRVTIILLIAIFIVLGFIYSSFFVVPKYSSYTTVLLAQTANDTEAQEGITTTDITLNSKLISTYSELIKSTRVIRKVISNLGIYDTEESIRENIKVTAVADTEILKITVSNVEPQKAADIANEIVKVFTEEVKERYKIDNVSTVDIAEPSEVPSNVNLAKDIIIFGIVGLVIGAGYVFIVFMLDNSVKSAEEVERSIEIPVLANIPIYEQNAQSHSRTSRNKKKAKGGNRR